jgi:hypothetical protein
VVNFSFWPRPVHVHPSKAVRQVVNPIYANPSVSKFVDFPSNCPGLDSVVWRNVPPKQAVFFIVAKNLPQPVGGQGEHL